MLHNKTNVIASSLDTASRQLTYLFAPVRGLVNLKTGLVFSFLALFVLNGYAQDINIPQVNIDGIDEDSTGDEIVVTIIKYVARIGIWAMMLAAGIVALKTILKSWNEQKQNDQGRWGAVMTDSIASVVMAVGVIAIGIWVLTFLD